MTVTLLDILGASRSRCAALPGELVGYLLLAVTEQVAGAPRRISLSAVVLGEDGGVRVCGGVAASESQAETALREAVKLMLASASPVTPPLLRIGNKPAGGGLAALARELEAALIPVNRAAGRRALRRLYRDAARALETGRVLIAAVEPAPTPVEPASLENDPASGAAVEVLIRSEPPSPALVVHAREDSTRPEPVVQRASQRPAPLPVEELDKTPPLGSLGSVPMPVAEEPARYLPDVQPELAELTERMPDAGEELPEESFDGNREGFEKRFEEQREVESLHGVDVSNRSPAAQHADIEELDAGWDVPLRSEIQAQLVAPEPVPHEALGLDPLTLTVPGLGLVEERRQPPTPPRRPEEAEGRMAFAPPRFLARRSDVDSLLRGFAVTEVHSERELCRELTELAGLEHGPLP
jgi:hypothetical protein